MAEQVPANRNGVNVGTADKEAADFREDDVQIGALETATHGMEDVQWVVPDAARDVQVGVVRDAARDIQVGAVRGAARDVQVVVVRDAARDVQVGAVRDAARDVQAGGVRDVARDVQLGVVRAAARNVQVGAVRDGARDVQVGDVRDAVRDLQVGAAEVPEKKETIFANAKNFIFTEQRDDGKYVPALNEEALAELKQVKEKLVVVSAVGAYRTGKSYLLSRLSERSGGNKFKVGHTFQPQTKGLWLMVTDHPALPGHKLALIDTEGIGDTQKGDMQHDTTVFVLTCLLSDTMIYNGRNAIDESAFEKLGFTAEMSKYIVSKKKDDDEDFQTFFPELLYVVRDFSLELEAEGRSITPDQYFENALAVSADEDPKSERVKVRKCIKKFFKRRKCFTLDSPAASKKLLTQMDQVADEKLNPDFIASMADLCNYILLRSKATTLQNGRQINGQQVAMLVETYVNAFRSDEVPNISSAMETLKKEENRKALENAEQEYHRCGEIFRDEHMPTETMLEVEEAHLEMVQGLTERAQGDAILEDTEIADFILDLEKRLNTQKDYFMEENRRISREACKRKLTDLYRPIEDKKRTTYNKPGAYQEFRQDIKKLKDKYTAAGGLGVMKKAMLVQFMEEKATDDETLLAMDKAICEKEKQVTEEKQKAKREKERNEELKRQVTEREREMKARENQFDLMMDKFEKTLQHEREERKQTEEHIQNIVEERNKQSQEDWKRFMEMQAAYQPRREPEKKDGSRCILM